MKNRNMIAGATIEQGRDFGFCARFAARTDTGQFGSRGFIDAAETPHHSADEPKSDADAVTGIDSVAIVW